MPEGIRVGEAEYIFRGDNADLLRAIRQNTAALGRQDQRVGQSQRQLASYARAVGVAAAAYAAFQTARRVVQTIADISDEATRSRNAIRPYVESIDQLNSVYDTLFEQAQRTGTAVEANTDLFRSLSIALEGTGIQQQRILEFTETLNLALIASGSNAQEASGALRQLGQGLASGALRGDEFNSVAEQMPLLMDAIAEATGRPRTALREFAAEGGITRDVVVAAMGILRRNAERDFGLMEQTIEQASQRASDSLRRLASEVLNSSTIIVDALNAIGRAADSIRISLFDQNDFTASNQFFSIILDGLRGIRDFLPDISLAPFDTALDATITRLENLLARRNELAAAPLFVGGLSGVPEPPPETPAPDAGAATDLTLTLEQQRQLFAQQLEFENALANAQQERERAARRRAEVLEADLRIAQDRVNLAREFDDANRRALQTIEDRTALIGLEGGALEAERFRIQQTNELRERQLRLEREVADARRAYELAVSRGAAQETVEQLADNLNEAALRQQELNALAAMFPGIVEMGAQQIEAAYDRLEALENVRNAIRSIAQASARFVIDTVTGVESLGDAFRNLANNVLTNLISRFIEAQVEALALQAASAIFPGIGGLLGFQSGGRPPVGTPVLVGERGPELFVADRSGTIIPNNQLSGLGGNVTNNFALTVNAIDALGVQSQVRAMLPEIEAVTRGGDAIDATRRSQFRDALRRR